MSGIDPRNMAVACLLNQALRCLGWSHLIFLGEQEQGGAHDLVNGYFALIVLVASFETDVENVLVWVAGQDAPHERFAAAQQPCAWPQSAGWWGQGGMGKHIHHVDGFVRIADGIF